MQSTAERILSSSWKLSGNDDYKRTHIRSDINEQGRTKMSMLINEPEEKKCSEIRDRQNAVLLECERSESEVAINVDKTTTGE